MSPFLTTLGGGSVRGFGRSFRQKLGPLVPTITITGVGMSGNTTLIGFSSNVANQTAYLYEGSSIIGSQNSQGGAFFIDYFCTTKTMYAKLYNPTTNTFSDSSNSLTYTFPAQSNGTLLSSVCSGNDAILTYSNGTCGGTYTQTNYNTIQCNPPLNILQINYYSSGSYLFYTVVLYGDRSRSYSFNINIDFEWVTYNSVIGGASQYGLTNNNLDAYGYYQFGIFGFDTYNNPGEYRLNAYLYVGNNPVITFYSNSYYV